MASEQLQAALAAQGIHTGIHYPIPVHMKPAFEDPQFRAGDFQCREQGAQEVLSLPMYGELAPEQLVIVADAIRSFKPVPAKT